MPHLFKRILPLDNTFLSFPSLPPYKLKKAYTFNSPRTGQRRMRKIRTILTALKWPIKLYYVVLVGITESHKARKFTKGSNESVTVPASGAMCKQADVNRAVSGLVALRRTPKTKGWVGDERCCARWNC